MMKPHPHFAQMKASAEVMTKLLTHPDTIALMARLKLNASLSHAQLSANAELMVQSYFATPTRMSYDATSQRRVGACDGGNLSCYSYFLEQGVSL